MRRFLHTFYQLKKKVVKMWFALKMRTYTARRTHLLCDRLGNFSQYKHIRIKSKRLREWKKKTANHVLFVINTSMRKQKTDWMRDQMLQAKRIEKIQHKARTVVVVVVSGTGDEQSRERTRVRETERRRTRKWKPSQDSVAHSRGRIVLCERSYDLVAFIHSFDDR